MKLKYVLSTVPKPFLLLPLSLGPGKLEDLVGSGPVSEASARGDGANVCWCGGGGGVLVP